MKLAQLVSENVFAQVICPTTWCHVKNFSDSNNLVGLSRGCDDLKKVWVTGHGDKVRCHVPSDAWFCLVYNLG